MSAEAILTQVQGEKVKSRTHSGDSGESAIISRMLGKARSLIAIHRNDDRPSRRISRGSLAIGTAVAAALIPLTACSSSGHEPKASTSVSCPAAEGNTSQTYRVAPSGDLPPTLGNSAVDRAADMPHALTPIGFGQLVDEPYYQATGNVIVFQYQPNVVDPQYGTGGSVEVRIIVGPNNPGDPNRRAILRTASWQVTPKDQAGGLVDDTDKPFLSARNVYPVVGQENCIEHDIVALSLYPLRGPGSVNLGQPLNARYYKLSRIGDTESVEYVANAELKAKIAERDKIPSSPLVPKL